MAFIEFYCDDWLSIRFGDYTVVFRTMNAFIVEFDNHLRIKINDDFSIS